MKIMSKKLLPMIFWNSLPPHCLGWHAVMMTMCGCNSVPIFGWCSTWQAGTLFLHFWEVMVVFPMEFGSRFLSLVGSLAGNGHPDYYRQYICAFFPIWKASCAGHSTSYLDVSSTAAQANRFPTYSLPPCPWNWGFEGIPGASLLLWVFAPWWDVWDFLSPTPEADDGSHMESSVLDSRAEMYLFTSPATTAATTHIHEIPANKMKRFWKRFSLQWWPS